MEYFMTNKGRLMGIDLAVKVFSFKKISFKKQYSSSRSRKRYNSSERAPLIQKKLRRKILKVFVYGKKVIYALCQEFMSE